MWFRNKKQNEDISSTDSAETLLESIHSNGVNLSLAELLQYQTKYALINLTSKKNIHGKQSGNYLSRTKGRGMEFDEVRHYQIGDDTRAIDWRVTARTGKTHTKLFREEIERPVLVATDLSNSMHFGTKLLFKSVQAAHLAALVAWHAKNRGDRLGGLVFSDKSHIELKPRSRKSGVLHYLHALTLLNKRSNEESTIEKPLQENSPTTQTTDEFNEALGDEPSAIVNFSDHCARLRQLAKPGSLVYLITDGHALLNGADEGDNQNKQQNALRHLMHISQHCELVVCLINDPLELALPETSMKLSATLTDGIARQQLTLGDKKTSNDYQRQAIARNELKQKALIKIGARVLQFDAGVTLEQQLKNNEVTQ